MVNFTAKLHRKKKYSEKLHKKAIIGHDICLWQKIRKIENCAVFSLSILWYHSGGTYTFSINFQMTIDFSAFWLVKIHCHWSVTIAFLSFFIVMNLKWNFFKLCWLLFVNIWKFILKQLVALGSVITSYPYSEGTVSVPFFVVSSTETTVILSRYTQLKWSFTLFALFRLLPFCIVSGPESFGTIETIMKFKWRFCLLPDCLLNLLSEKLARETQVKLLYKIWNFAFLDTNCERNFR